LGREWLSSAVGMSLEASCVEISRLSSSDGFGFSIGNPTLGGWVNYD